MSEEKTNEESKPEVPKEDSKDGVQSETTSELDRADQIAERQLRANKERLEILEREENLEARRKVGGVTEAGKPADKPKEETDEEYHDRFMKGDVNPMKEDGIK